MYQTVILSSGTMGIGENSLPSQTQAPGPNRFEFISGREVHWLILGS